MAHSILLSDVIELIFINDTSYELDEYCQATGLDKQDLIKSADSVETHNVYEERSIGDTFTEAMDDLKWEDDNLTDNPYNY